ncbi:MAG: hypothetical protein WAS55_05585 [Saprospiraceae bacterium]
MLNLVAQTPVQLLNSISQKFQIVQDYQADVFMQFDIPFIRIEQLNGKVYFKQPDKFQVKTQGIAFLPKQDPYYALAVLRDTSQYIAVESGKQLYGKTLSRIIQVIPHDQTDLVLAKFWIDPENKLILRSQLTTQSNGTIQIDYEYGRMKTYCLPDIMLFTVEVAKFKVPKAIAVDLNSKKKDSKLNSNSKEIGKIKLTFTNYVINQKLPDTIFKK